MAARPHRLEGVRLSTRPIQRDHQVRAQPLAQRMLGHQGLELADEFFSAAIGQLGRQPLLDRLQPELLQTGDLALGELVEAVVRQWLTSPQRQRRLQIPHGAFRIVLAERDPRPSKQLLKPTRVDVQRIDVQRVARQPMDKQRPGAGQPLTKA